MIIKFVDSIVGRDYTYRPGDVLDLPEKEALVWLNAKLAVLVEEVPEMRTATVEQSEVKTATVKTRKPRKAK